MSLKSGQISWEQLDALKFKARVVGAKEAASPMRNHYVLHQVDSLDGVEFKGPRKALAGLLTLPRVTSGSAIPPPHLTVAQPSLFFRTTNSLQRPSTCLKESVCRNAQFRMRHLHGMPKTDQNCNYSWRRRFSTCETSLENNESKHLRHG